jgi:protein-L-isoaspartate(D-aspartate) O-methyltransferase
MSARDFSVARERMVREQVLGKGITDPQVLKALSRVPRHLFLDPEGGAEAYADHSLPIGFSQTMSQPYMVAYLAAELQLGGEESVLEVGTGSGYQAAVLATLAKRVYTIERIPELAARAAAAIEALGIISVYTRVGDGAVGWREMAPFDRILLTAAAEGVPQDLLEQLRDGGFLLGPVVGSNGRQEVVRLVRRGDRFALERLRPCTFVPLVRFEGQTTLSVDANNPGTR